MKTECIKCKQPCTLGENAITTDQGDQCDTCAGVIRGINGYAFEEQVNASGLHCTCIQYDGHDKKCPVHGTA